MKNRNRRSARVLSVILTALFAFQQGMLLSANATNITGVANTTGGTGSTYNIDPTGIIKNTDIGYRKYKNFNLSEGDIANLMFRYGIKDINTFINLVDNQIKIDGIVNTMRGDSFYNGRAIFVSPNGMVVGASGVLNVGSLGVYTPNNDVYNSYKNNPSSNLSALNNLNNNKDGYVTINGKVIAAQDIDIMTGRVEVPGKMIAGTGNNLVATGRQRAEEIFNNIVNTSNVVSANSLSNKNGVITISSGIGTDISGLVTNYGKGSTNINNSGHQGINISGNVSNLNGDMNIRNTNNDIYLASTGKLKNSNGTMKLINTGNGIYIVDGSKIVNDNNLSVYNAGPEGIHMAGAIENKGTVDVYNTNGIVSISGSLKNNGNTTITNDGTQLNVTGTIDNKNGTLKMLNNGVEGLHLVNTSVINSEGIELYNTGNDGLDMHGKINNKGNAKITNTATANGDYGLGLYGEFNNSNGNVEMLNDGAAGLNVYGSLKNENGQTTLINHGKGGLNVAQKGNIDTKGISMYNDGEVGLNVWGTVKNEGNGTYTNMAGSLDVKESGKMYNTNGIANYYNNGVNGLVISGKVENEGTTNAYNENGYLSIGGSFANKGDSTFTNKGSQFNVSGKVDNTNGKLTMVNNGAKGFYLVSSGEINSEGLVITNTGEKGLTANGKINNTGNANITNTSEGVEGTKISGTITNNKGLLNINNEGKGGLQLYEKGEINSFNINKDSLKMTNSGEGGMYLRGNVYALGNSNFYNTENGKAGMNIIGKVKSENGNAYYLNNGEGGLNVYGESHHTSGNTAMTNNGSKGFNVASTGVVFADNAILTNNGNDGMNINGRVQGVKLDLINNEGGVKGLNINGTIEQGIVDPHAPRGYLNVQNSGKEGLNVRGKIHAYDEVYLTNTGADGTYIDSKARITGEKSIAMNDTSKGGTRVQGLIKAKNDINVKEKGGNFVIGDKTENNNYMTAGNNIKMNVQNGSILNYGVEKVLLNAGNDLTMDVTDGTIGLPVGQLACEGTGCVGIGPKAEGARDFTKSVNANVKGKVKASTTDTTVSKEKDLVINYAAIDSDMNIETIKADGRVILTVDDDYGLNNEGKRYNMVNVNTDPTKTNVEGWGISMISNGSIGTKVKNTEGNETIKPVTFIQTKAEDGYGMDALANENIYLKENSYNDANYGRDKEIKTNKVCTMIAREGDLDVEFAGNTKIENITAEGDLKVVTRGKTLEIENLGHIVDESVIPEDYFGPRDYGQKDGGYMEEDYRDEALPNNATVKALDINHNIRPTEELVDEGHEAWADSTVRIKNAVLDKGKLDVTADNVYANGIEAHFGRDGFTKAADPSTNPVIGSDGIPTGHAVRPDDVKATGRNDLERNYYYHPGSGDGIFNGVPSHVDSDNGIVDATPLALADSTPNNPAISNDDGRITFIKQKDTYVESIDKRQYMRFNVSSNTNPVLMEKNNNMERLIDVSRGGIAVRHNNTLKVGDIVPVHLTYGDLDIHADAKIVSATTNRAGAEFVNIDQGVANQLLYLNMLLERNMKQLAMAK